MTTTRVVELLSQMRENCMRGNLYDDPERNGKAEALDYAMFAVKYLELESDRYRWHDLRKDPDDLPKEDGEYYAYQYCYYCRTSDPNSEVYEPMYTIIFVKDGKINDCYEGGEIIAWRKIEPFEVSG